MQWQARQIPPIACADSAGAEPPLADRLSRPHWVTRRMITSVQKLRYLDALGLVGQEVRASASPTEPHKSATRRLTPTEIPRTKRHTPVHLLCVLKVWRTAGDQR